VAVGLATVKVSVSATLRVPEVSAKLPETKVMVYRPTARVPLKEYRQVLVVPTRTGVPSAISVPDASRRMTSPPPIVAGSMSWPYDPRKVISMYFRRLMTSRPTVWPESAESAVAPTTVKP